MSARLDKTEDWQEISVSLSKFKNQKEYMHAMAVQPVPGMKNANWMIKSIIIE